VTEISVAINKSFLVVVLTIWNIAQVDASSFSDPIYRDQTISIAGKCRQHKNEDQTTSSKDYSQLRLITSRPSAS
jgi:hypothetical protein